jgi:acetyl-CoA acetyltransferase
MIFARLFHGFSGVRQMLLSQPLALQFNRLAASAFTAIAVALDAIANGLHELFMVQNHFHAIDHQSMNHVIPLPKISDIQNSAVAATMPNTAN